MARNDQPTDTYGQRLAYLMWVRGYVETEDFARALRKAGMSITGSAIGQVISGATKMMNAVNHSRVCAIMQCSPLWLACNEGPAPTKEDVTTNILDFPGYDSSTERVLELMRATDAKGRARCLEAVAVALSNYEASQSRSPKTSGE